jgi:phage terminase large subunit-like protein
MQLDAQKMLEGVIDDDKTFALIYTIDQGDDWASLTALRKANPNFGVSVGDDFLADRLADAKNNSRKQSTYQTKHLNVWVGAREAYFNMDRWRECADESLKLSDFAGKRCFIGLDLASKVDIAALEVLFPLGNGDFARFGRYYLPESALQNSVSEHYRAWSKDGWMTITDGEIIDFAVIRDDILDICRAHQVVECAYDPFQATMLVTELMGQGVPVVEMRPTVLNFSEPMKQLDGLIRARRIRHAGDPVMSWMVSNVVAREDAKDNVFPRKDRPENKIDGVVALLMALGRSMTATNDDDIAAALGGFISVRL